MAPFVILFPQIFLQQIKILTKNCRSVLNHDKSRGRRSTMEMCICRGLVSSHTSVVLLRLRLLSCLSPTNNTFFIKILIKICPFATAGTVLIYTLIRINTDYYGLLQIYADFTGTLGA